MPRGIENLGCPLTKLSSFWGRNTVTNCNNHIKIIEIDQLFNLMLYEEGLNQQTLEDAVFYISHADVLIIGGTSLAVYPAAGLIDYYRGCLLYTSGGWYLYRSFRCGSAG